MARVNPVLVELRRGDIVESHHRGAFAVVEASGRVICRVGNIEKPVLVNSALKLVQVLPFIATGAADRWKCSAAEIVLAASSHIGQEFQRDALKAWLARIGLAPGALQCGTAEPFDRGARNAMIRRNNKPTVFHYNSVGKHIGILATCLHKAEGIASYLHPGHPAQIRIRKAIEAVAELDERPFHGLIDRCSMQSVPVSLHQLATASARLGTGAHLEASLAKAAARLIASIRVAPTYLVGPGRLSTTVCEVTKGRIIVKGGLEGSFTAIDTARGRGYALKIDDGAGRAADVAIFNLLAQDNALSEDEQVALARFGISPVRSYTGAEIGAVQCVDGAFVPDKTRSPATLAQISADTTA